ncbi:MAG: tRNA (N6-threonylcarbamoyladenosine(37)-N6)-methyltransferase TrmO [Thermodesulfobacteriota bacterium]
MKIEFTPIGYLYTQAKSIPRHWSVSDVKGSIVIDQKYESGLKDISKGQAIVVIFYFDRSPDFSSSCLIQRPPHKDRDYGVFSICSPRRPNPIGMSVLEVLDVEGNTVYVNRVDMLDATPVLDIKPYIGYSKE